MLPAVAALAAFALAVCLLDLVLTLGVLRRLREHSQLIAKLAPVAPPLDPMLAVGQSAGPFSTVATTGEAVTRDQLAGETVVGVFTPHCPACQERMPGFIEYARGYAGGRSQVLAVIVGAEAETAAYRERLEPVARVVIEPPAGGSITTALAVGAFPAFGVLDSSGKVLRSGLELDEPVGAATR